MGPELGQAQPGFGLGLKKFDLKNANKGFSKVCMFNFNFETIVLWGLNQIKLDGNKTISAPTEAVVWAGAELGNMVFQT